MKNFVFWPLGGVSLHFSGKNAIFLFSWRKVCYLKRYVAKTFNSEKNGKSFKKKILFYRQMANAFS